MTKTQIASGIYSLRVQNIDVKFRIDSGADITLINKETFNKINEYDSTTVKAKL